MTPATAYLTFTEHKLRVLAGDPVIWRERLAAGGFHDPLDAVRHFSRTELARRASGTHCTREDALDYARREGPAFVLCPNGEVLRVERARDAGLDAAAAAEETAFAEQLRRLTFREAVGPAAARGI